jgi:hypothetical protein
MLRQKATAEAESKHAADLIVAAKFENLRAAAVAAEEKLRQAQARRAGVEEIHALAKDLDAALTAAMQSAYARQRAAIGPLGYDDRIYFRKAKAKPAIHQLTADAERLLTLRETHRMNGIPDLPRVPAV